MGVTEHKIYKCTCDICKIDCKKDDGVIKIIVNNGDRDVGPATIDGIIKFNQPYGVSNGIICNQCKMKWLLKYCLGYDLIAVQKERVETVIEFVKNCGQDKVFADATIIKMLEDLKNDA